MAVRELESEMLSHRFGIVPDFPLGIEEELLVADPATGRLEPAADTFLDPRPGSGGGWLAREIFAAELELVTPICATVGQAAAVLRALATDVHQAGRALLGVGLHPDAREGEVDICASPRYAEISHALQGLLRTPTAALHVHVGMPDPETAVRASNGLRRHLPLLHSLGANSPYWFGRDSGLASARTAILRSYPRYGVPPWFEDWGHFCRLADELSAAAGAPDYTYFWWDVRPHPRLGTVELRAPDAQFSVERSVCLAALMHALTYREANDPSPLRTSRDAIEEGCYQASRYGLDAELPDHRGGRRPARELARETIDSLRDHAQAVGCENELEGVERILIEGDGASVQRRIWSRRGKEGLIEWLMAQR